MTEPLTPPDCNLTDFRFMGLDVVRLRDSDLASEQSPEENWAALMLWCASWHQVPAASIPASEQWQAKHAGYLARGKIDPAWNRIKAGALRGYVLCDDGRLYHPVVAEKAREAWESKLEQRWRTEVARIKKHNDRHGTTHHRPSLEEWLSTGRPSGHALSVPGDSTAGVPGDSTGDIASKRQGEGQGQGEGSINPNTSTTNVVVVPPAAPVAPAAAPAKAKKAKPDSAPVEPHPDDAPEDGSMADTDVHADLLPRCPQQKVRDLWAKLLPDMPQHVQWTEHRKTLLRVRWKQLAREKQWKTEQDGLHYFAKLFRHIGTSAFLTGRAPAAAGRTVFVATLEWVLKAGNLAKIVDGNYHPD